MGSLCSNIEKDNAPGEKNDQERRNSSNNLTRSASKRLQKKSSHRRRRQQHRSVSPIADFIIRHQADMDMAQKMVTAHDEVIDGTRDGLNLQPRSKASAAIAPAKIGSVDEFMRLRENIQHRENTLSFDFSLTVKASPKEKRADAIIQILKADDKRLVYDAAEPRLGWGGQKHVRYAGDHFLSNVELIERTSIYRVATQMPKGAHLHIHFNACLKPNVLLDIAKTMNRMFITSDLSLAPAGDGVTETAAQIALDRCEIQFSILRPDKEVPGDIFSTNYEARQTMKYTQFLEIFRQTYTDKDPERWLASKLMFNEEEAYNHLQTVQGSWEKFNGRTRMMKGLFNYEFAYRAYTRAILADFVRDNIQYAEIRPNFMDTNHVWKDDGSNQIENEGIMEILIEEYEQFQRETKDYFGGMKVIYCTPRSFSNSAVQFALNQCLAFKKRWPKWIAGFDLVGEESKGRPLKAFVPELLQFKSDCEKAGVEIPFLFHCGETNEIGSDTDGNLVDALLLNSKRIGHGFALARHPYIMEHMKKKGICLEVCPISNEELGLTPRIGGHSMYNLLANNVHCTVNSDNGTIFRSSLSHDFYQVMVGKSDMTLHGWRQLIEWSLEHSCMSRNELAAVRAQWVKRWEVFLDWIISEYGDVQALADN